MAALAGLGNVMERADKTMTLPREEERFPYYTEIVIESDSGTRGARISDVSHGGCYIDTIAPAREGEEISFEIESKAGGTLRITGTVAYVIENMGFGVKFSDLTEEYRAVIDEIIKSAGGA